MNWMRERDALIAQTMAFVQAVTGKRPEFGQRDAAAAPPPGLIPEAAAGDVSKLALAEARHPETPSPAPDSPVPEASLPAAAQRPLSPFQAEVAARVASFRKHQERFSREREAYFSATIARAKDPAAERSAPPADK